MTDIKPGDVVQVDPDEHPTFAGCFLLVEEVHSWGVQGFVGTPAKPNPSRAYLRVKWEHLCAIGEAEWLPVKEELQ